MIDSMKFLSGVPRLNMLPSEFIDLTFQKAGEDIILRYLAEKAFP